MRPRAGAVHQHVHPSLAGEQIASKLLEVLIAGEIPVVEDELAGSVRAARRRLELVPPSRDGAHGRIGRRERDRDRPADAAARAGDDAIPAAEPRAAHPTYGASTSARSSRSAARLITG